MRRESNPYLSPPSREPNPAPWWELVWYYFFPKPPLTPDQRFLAGETAIHYGVIFRVDPRDGDSITASLPLAVNDDEHVRRNIDEACRVTVEFLMLHSSLIETLRHRRLVVSMISSYENVDDEIWREVIPARVWTRGLPEADG